MLRSLFAFRTRHQPYMVRLSYRYEMLTALTYPLAASLAEGGFTATVAGKYFQASRLLMAVIFAAPMFGNIVALGWAEMAQRRRKVPFVNLLQVGVVSSIAAVALTGLFAPADGGGLAGWLFAACIISARVLASGIVTVRSSIWRANYPAHVRGQIVARISVTAAAVFAITTLLGSRWLDYDARAFIYLYPLAALLGAAGIWQFSHIRVRRERTELRRLQISMPRPENLSQTDEATVMNYQAKGERKGLRIFFADAMSVLRQDPAFRQYQWWQFLNGGAFMMFGPALQYMVAREMTDPQKEYQLATMVLQIIPMVVTILFTQLWAPLFDRLNILRFRAVQSCITVIAISVLCGGAMLDHLWLVAVGQFLVGISNAAGNLAWNLGHMDFAPPEKCTTYMGVHVMLTGLRGCVAPFVGVALYYVPFIGRGVFGVSVAMSLAAFFGFRHMARTSDLWHRKVQREREIEPEAVGAGR